MSYCRFENTSSDFADCVNALREEELSDLSREERLAAKQLYELAQEYVQLYEEAVDYDNEIMEDC